MDRFISGSPVTLEIYAQSKLRVPDGTRLLVRILKIKKDKLKHFSFLFFFVKFSSCAVLSRNWRGGMGHVCSKLISEQVH